MVEIAPLKLSKLMLHIANIAESKCADSNFFYPVYRADYVENLLYLCRYI